MQATRCQKFVEALQSSSELTKKQNQINSKKWAIRCLRFIVGFCQIVNPYYIERSKSQSDPRYRYVFYDPWRPLVRMTRSLWSQLIGASSQHESQQLNINQRQRQSRCSPRIQLLNLINLYVFVKLILSSYFQLQFEHLSAEHKLSIAPQANASKFCVLKEDLFEPEDIKQKLEYTSSWLRYLGISYSVHNDFVSLIVAENALTILCLYISSSLNLGKCIILDSYSFLRNSQLERKRMHLNISKNINTIFNCTDEDLAHSQHTTHRESRLKSLTASDTSDVNSSGSSCCACSYRQRLRRHLFLKFIKRENIIQHLKPGSRSKFAAKISITTKLVSFVALFVSIIIIAVFYHYIIFKLEFDSRVSRRLKLIECQRWNPNALLIRDTMKFMVEPVDNNNFMNWTQIINSQGFTDNLMARIKSFELSNMLSRKYVLFEIEMILFIASTGAWFSLYLTNLFGDYSVRLCWINQIQGQLRDCIRQLDDQLLPVALNQLPKRKRRLDRSLTLTFLNFELFRLESQASSASQNFYAEQIALFSLGSLGLGFFILSKIHSKNPNVIYGITMLSLIIANWLIALCAIATDRIQKIYHSLNDLLARASTNSMELTYIISVWRRHLLTDSEVMDHYSTSAFGIHLSTENLIAIDSSIFGIWLLIYRG